MARRAQVAEGRWSTSSLSQVEGWHAPAGRRTWEPRPLAQARQIRPAAPVGAKRTWARPTGRFRRQPAASADWQVRPDPGHRPYAQTDPNCGSRAGALSTSSLPSMRCPAMTSSPWPSCTERPVLAPSLLCCLLLHQHRMPTAPSGRSRPRAPGDRRAWERVPLAALGPCRDPLEVLRRPLQPEISGHDGPAEPRP